MRNYSNEELSLLHEHLFQLLLIFKDVCEKADIWYSLAFGTLLGAVREGGFIPWDTDADVFIKVKDKNAFREAFKKFAPDGYYLSNYDADAKCLSSHDTIYIPSIGQLSDIHIDIYPIIGAPNNKKEQDKVSWLWHYLDRIIRSKYVNIRECKTKNKPLVFFAKIIDYCIPDSVLKKNRYKRETKYNFETSKYWMTLVNYGVGHSCFKKELIISFDVKSFEGVDFHVMNGWNEFLTICYGDYMTPKKY